MSGKLHSDISDKLERVEAFEQRLGVRLEALAARLERFEDEDDVWLHVMGELHAANGGSLSTGIELTVACYDAEGRVCATESDTFFEDDFHGFEVFKVSFMDTFDSSSIGGVARIRVFPKSSG